MTPDTRPMPRAIGVLIVFLAALQPLVHALILWAPPAGTVATGLHIPDSALFLESMDMFSSGFASPYATCQATQGDQAMTYYSVPHLWLYGLLGLLKGLVPVSPFLLYGIANGLGMACFLGVTYRFLAVVVPRQATTAFLLFALGGGPGGMLYLVTGMLGMHDTPSFEVWFFRFAVYDLMEGPHFNPVLYGPRLYYTLSLAGCLAALTSLITWTRGARSRLPWGGLVALLLASFLNARYGTFTSALMLMYVLLENTATPKRRLLAATYFLLASGLGVRLALLLLRSNPAVVENHVVVGNMAMWFSPFILVAAYPLLMGAPYLYQRLQGADRILRILLSATVGYLSAYGIGYLLYQGYYGNLLTGNDGTVAAAISDGALLGALIGLLWGGRHRGDASSVPAVPDWILLWFLSFTALSLSGFGQGWFLRFGPQRLQIFLWLPLAILAAQGLTLMAPTRRKVAQGIVLGMGTTSMGVALVAFQTPLGRHHAEGPWPTLHAESMSLIDQRLLEHLGEGTVLAPAPAADVVVRQHRNPVVFGVGSFNLTDQAYSVLAETVATFLDPATPEATRRDLADTWCVDWVYLPHTWSVAEGTRAALDQYPWLETVAREGRGALYRVRSSP